MEFSFTLRVFFDSGLTCYFHVRKFSFVRRVGNDVIHLKGFER